MMHKIDKALLILIFCSFIYIPFFTGIFQEDRLTSGVEKRTLNRLPKPPTSLDQLKSYPKKYNAYYSDHFGYRETFTKEYFKLVNSLGSNASLEDVTIGQDGWLFLGSIRPGYMKYGDPMGDAINVNLFTENELQQFAERITATKNWLSGKGIHYIYTIAPNKHTIYADKLPEYISKRQAKSAMDQLFEYLQKHTDVAVVDLRPALFNEKKKYPIYFKTDTHWNSRGANIAQFVIMEKAREFFPEKISPILLDDSQFNSQIRGAGDLAILAKLENVKEDNPTPSFKTNCTPINLNPEAKGTETHTEECEGNKLNALIFHDSFFEPLWPFVSRQFYHSTYVWKKTDNDLLAKYIAQEKPDIVIEEVVERTLPYVPSK